MMTPSCQQPLLVIMTFEVNLSRIVVAILETKGCFRHFADRFWQKPNYAGCPRADLVKVSVEYLFLRRHRILFSSS